MVKSCEDCKYFRKRKDWCGVFYECKKHKELHINKEDFGICRDFRLKKQEE